MNNDRRWYIIQTYSGFENSVKEDLERRIETMGQQDYIFNVLIPEEEYEDTKKDGSKVINNSSNYIKMWQQYCDSDLFNHIAQTNSVGGMFVAKVASNL